MKTSRWLQAALVLLLVVALVPVVADAQQDQKKKKKKKKAPEAAVEETVVDVESLYDSGSYAEVVAKVSKAQEGGAKVNAEALYLAGRSYEGLKETAAARSSYDELAARGAEDPWGLIGQSAAKTLAGDLPAALAAADRAVAGAASNPLAHYQKGLVLVKQRSFADAAAAFVRALELEGDFSYGHYYAGMSYHQTRNLVAAANHLRRFLELAPEAPERIEVMSILATIQG